MVRWLDGKKIKNSVFQKNFNCKRNFFFTSRSLFLILPSTNMSDSKIQPLVDDSSMTDDVPQETKEKKESKKTEEDGLDKEEVTGIIKIITKDQREFTVERKDAQISTLVKTTLEQDTAATEMPLPGVTSSTMARVVEYMQHHKGTEPPIIPKPLRSKEMKQVCSDPWDAQYIDKIGDTRQDLYDLILAANYLDIKSLLHLGCAKVASLIKGQPLEKIKEILTQGMKKDDDKKEGKKNSD